MTTASSKITNDKANTKSGKFMILTFFG